MQETHASHSVVVCGASLTDNMCAKRSKDGNPEHGGLVTTPLEG